MEFETLAEVVSETLGCAMDKVTPEARLEEDLGADSLAAMELIMAVEERFDITFEDDMMDKVKTVGELFDYVQTQA